MIWRFLFLGLSILSFSNGAVSATLITKTIGVVGDHVLTSRELAAEFLFVQAVQGRPDVSVPSMDSKDYSSLVDQLLREWSVYLESKNFEEFKVSEEEVKKQMNTLRPRLEKSSAWKALDVTTAELLFMIERRLRTDKLLEFKTELTSVPITDAEARAHYDSNKGRFGNLPFENFKDNIKTFLARQQVQKRLNDWLEVLKGKYKVRNLSNDAEVR